MSSHSHCNGYHSLLGSSATHHEGTPHAAITSTAAVAATTAASANSASVTSGNQQLHTSSNNTSTSASTNNHHHYSNHSDRTGTDRKLLAPRFFAELNTDLASYADAASSTSSAGGRPRSAWRRLRMRLASLCDSQAFKDWSTERLYRKYAFRLERSLLSRFLLTFVCLLLALTSIDYAFGQRFSYKAAVYVAAASMFLFVAVFVHSRLMKAEHTTATCALALLVVSLFAATAFPVSWVGRQKSAEVGQQQHHQLFTVTDGLWQIGFAVFCVYCLLPGQLFATAVYGGLLSSSYLLCSAVLAYHQQLQARCLACEHLHASYWTSVIGAALVLLGINTAGVAVQRFRDGTLRQSFLETKACISHQLQLEDESYKLDRLVQAVVPLEMAPEVKADFMHGNFGWKVAQVTQTPYLSIMSACVTGLTQFPSTFPASDAVRLMNQIFCRLDQLAYDHQAYRVRIQGDEYTAAIGFPDECPDHAKQAVRFAQVLVEMIGNLSECSQLPLDVRIGINSGVAYSVLLGKCRLTYDVVGEQVTIARRLQQICPQGRILLAKSTYLELVDTDLRAEPGPLLERLLPGCGSRGGAGGSGGIVGGGRTKLETVAIKPRTLLTSSKASSRPQQLDESNRAEGLKRLSQYASHHCESPFQYIGEMKVNQSQRLKQTEDLLRCRPSGKSSAPLIANGHASKSHVEDAELGRTLGLQQPQVGRQPLTVLRRCRTNMNPVTLKFTSQVKENEFHRQEDHTFGIAMLIALLILLVSAGVQAAVLPRTMLLLLLFMIAFTWIGMMLMVLLAARLKCLEFNIQSSFVIRIVVIITSVLFVYSVSQANAFCCRTTVGNRTAYGPILREIEHASELQCPVPDFIYLSGSLCLILVSVFASLPSFLKLFLLTAVSATFALTVAVTHRPLFTLVDIEVRGLLPLAPVSPVPDMSAGPVPSFVWGIVCLAAFSALIFVHARFQEFAQRQEFQWKSQSIENQHDMFLVKETSCNLLKNLLPHHVALHFTDTTYRNPVDLYSQEYPLLGILWANLPDWQPATNEAPLLVQESIRVLNDVICELDELLQRADKHQELVKVRTVGENYVVAVGMNPQLQDNPASKLFYLTSLVQLAQLMRRRVAELNATLYDDRVRLRVGIDLGPGFCGVVGGSRPVFDVWGQVASVSRALVSTAGANQILVSDRVYQVAQQQFDFVEQGTLMVDGLKVRAMALREGRPAGPSSGRRSSVTNTTVGPGQAQNRPATSVAAVGTSTAVGNHRQQHSHHQQQTQQQQQENLLIESHHSLPTTCGQGVTNSLYGHSVLRPIPESTSTASQVPASAAASVAPLRVVTTAVETQTPPLQPPMLPPQQHQQRPIPRPRRISDTAASQSSLSSFLMHESAAFQSAANEAARGFPCSDAIRDQIVTSDDDDMTVNDDPATSSAAAAPVSHRNPLYTDTEYDSMAESSANIFLELSALKQQQQPPPPPRPPRTQIGVSVVNQHQHSHSSSSHNYHNQIQYLHMSRSSQQQQPPQPPPPLPAPAAATHGKRTSASPSVEGSQRSTPSARHLDFPEYTRPSPPILSPASRLSDSSGSRTGNGSKCSPPAFTSHDTGATLSLPPIETPVLMPIATTAVASVPPIGSSEASGAMARSAAVSNNGWDSNTCSSSTVPAVLFRLAKERGGAFRLAPVAQPGPSGCAAGDSLLSLVSDSVGAPTSGEEDEVTGGTTGCDDRRTNGGADTDLDILRGLQSDDGEISDILVSDIDEDCANFFQYVPQAYRPSQSPSANQAGGGGGSSGTPVRSDPFREDGDDSEKALMRAWNHEAAAAAIFSDSDAPYCEPLSSPLQQPLALPPPIQPHPPSLPASQPSEPPTPVPAQRCLPQVAPVGLPDFRLLPSSTPQGDDMGAVSDGEILIPALSRLPQQQKQHLQQQKMNQQLLPILQQRRSRRTEYESNGEYDDRPDDPERDEEDEEEGYSCDVPSSAYETHSETEDAPQGLLGNRNGLLRSHNNYHFYHQQQHHQQQQTTANSTPASKKSDYDNMNDDADLPMRLRAAGLPFVNGGAMDDSFHERIAAEARRISNVFRRDFCMPDGCETGELSEGEVPDQLIRSRTLAALLAPMRSNGALQQQQQLLPLNHTGSSGQHPRPLSNGAGLFGSLDRRPQQQYLQHHSSQRRGGRPNGSPLVAGAGGSLMRRASSLDQLQAAAAALENQAAAVAAPVNAASIGHRGLPQSFQKFVARHGKMRSVLPPELQRFILPGCISSSSLATSVEYPSDPSMQYSAYESEYDNYYYEPRKSTMV